MAKFFEAPKSISEDIIQQNKEDLKF